MKQLETTFTQNNEVFTQIKRSDKAALYKRETLEGAPVSYEVFAIKTKNDAEIYPAKHAFGGILGWAWCPIQLEKAETYFSRLNNGEVTLANVDPETGEVVATADERSLDELPDVNVSTEVVASVDVDPTAPVVVETPEETPVVVLPTVDGGGVVTVAVVKKNKVAKVLPTYKFPAGEWLRDDFAQLNGMQHHPAHSDSYGPLASLIKAGKVTEVRKEKRGAGKPRSIYTEVVATPVVAITPTVVATPATV
jgi:hypothetical protein